MKKMSLFSLIILTAATLIQCSPKTQKKVASDVTVEEKITPVNNQPVPGAMAKIEDIQPKREVPLTDDEKEAKSLANNAISEDELYLAGKLTWKVSCNKCHELYAPQERTASQWDKVMETMAVKAKLSKAEKSAVLAFLHNQAKQ
ncbi:MAG: hypothetical protein JNJ58_01975 [Chitinophagaceae bacterium]|nr:hypothetical protein [Chitinophagaceae bacterium]